MENTTESVAGAGDDVGPRQNFLDENVAMVKAMARRMSGRRGLWEDLVHEGLVGLLRAHERFDPERGSRFSTYARYWVRYQLQTFARRNRRIVTIPRTRNMVKARSAVRRTRRELEQERGGHVPSEEVAEALDIDVDDVLFIDAEHAGADVSVHGDANEREVQLESAAPDPETITIAIEEANDRRALLESCIETLKPRERFVVENHLLADDGMTLRQIGEELDVSGERVRQIEKRALERMRQTIEVDA